jgi:hypothetical protein
MVLYRLATGLALPALVGTTLVADAERDPQDRPV